MPLHSLSSNHFLSQIMSACKPATTKRIVAIFDFDKTVSTNDSYLSMSFFALRYFPRRCFCLGRLLYALVLFYLGRIDNTGLKKRFLAALLGGMSRERLTPFFKAFSSYYLHHCLRRDALRQIRRHQAQGHELVLASASFDFYISPLAAELGFTQLFCTRAAWKEQKLDGIDGENCYGNNKLKAIQAFFAASRDELHVIAYSDHHSDLPLLRWADQAYLVNPDRKTRKQAAGSGMEILCWA